MPDMNTSIDKAINILNAMFILDKNATANLLKHRVPVNKNMASTSLDFIIGGTDENPSMSALGLVNTLLLELTGSRVTMSVDEVSGQIVERFEEFQSVKKP